MRKLLPLVRAVNEYYDTLQEIPDEELRGKTDEFRKRFKEGETLDDLLPEAFAVVKEACRRHLGKTWMAAGIEITWDMVPYDVQIAGAIVLHRGKIAEMATGEGKTLVAIMPLYLNALAGEGVHLVTVNDYLARRDSEWMGHILEFLGMTVGCLDKTEPSSPERRAQYECDITYGTNHEFGFDYLRDNMVQEARQVVQRRGHYYAIVDEVDNILIDEARTPLIISGPVDRSTHRYDEVKPFVQHLIKLQTALITNFVDQADKMVKAGAVQDPEKSRELGVLLLRCQRALPKHRRFMKLLQEQGVKSLMEKTELDILAEKKMNDVDEGVYFVIDERMHQIDLTEIGRQALSPDNPKLWEMPDLVEDAAAVDAGDFEVVELNDGKKTLIFGTKSTREACKKPDGSVVVSNYHGTINIPADQIKQFVPGVDVSTEEKGQIKEFLRLDQAMQSEKLHNISQLLRAYTLYERDAEYVVQENKVIIVDEFTGRLMTGRRWSDGLHQAVECKENVEIEPETQTLATITLQNFFRLYKKLSGMTGTAETEAAEFNHTYKMDVVVVPTNRPVTRKDQNDLIYKTKREKYNAVIDEVKRLHNEGLPVLVGTVNVDVSQLLSRMLSREKIEHNVLNAKNHQNEAEIIRFAGQKGAVTIATNMAGRGTDIKLGDGVIMTDAKGRLYGGLQVLGTERHEARRIDRQLRGRSGRQGDPGRSQFFLSLEDDLMRLFGSDRISHMMDTLGAHEEGEPMVSSWLTKAVEMAQKKVETRNFEIRRRTLEFDEVMNSQRQAIYTLRKQALFQEDLREALFNIFFKCLENELTNYGDPRRLQGGEWNIDGFLGYIQRCVPYANFIDLKNDILAHDADYVLNKVMEVVIEGYNRKREQLGDDLNHQLSKWVILSKIDKNWIDHLLAIDDLREHIHWRSYGQVDPLVEFRREASQLFEDMMIVVQREIFEQFFLLQPKEDGAEHEAETKVKATEARHEKIASVGEDVEEPEPEQQPQQVMKMVPIRRKNPVSRNAPCPCGSGKKYKNCCGSLKKKMNN